MKILLLDVETAPAVAYIWRMFKENISIDQLVESGYTLCWSAKWLNSDEVMFDSLWTSGKKKFIRRIHKLLSEADAVVTYNGNKFDIPVLNREFLNLGLPPPAPFHSIDLYNVVRKNFRLQSNKLAYVVKFLEVGSKVKTIGFDLWKQVINGDTKAREDMEEYNREDTNLLEGVYYALLPWIQSHPNWALFRDTSEATCPNCGSTHLQSRGISTTKVGLYRRFQCQACGTWSRTRTTEVVPEQRKNILTRST